MTNLTVEQMEKIAERMSKATPEQIIAMAEKMAEERPDLLVGIADPSDRARGLVQLEFNNPDRNCKYLNGLVDGLWFSKLLTDDERQKYLDQIANFDDES